MTVDRRAHTCARWPGTWVVDRAVDRPESFALWFWVVDRAVDRFLPTVKNMTVGGRPAGRPPAARTDKQSQRLVFEGGLFKPHFFGILARFFRAKISLFSGFQSKFSKVFKEQKDSSYLF